MESNGDVESGGRNKIYEFVVKCSEVKCEKRDLTVQFGDKTGYYIDVMNT